MRQGQGGVHKALLALQSVTAGEGRQPPLTSSPREQPTWTGNAQCRLTLNAAHRVHFSANGDGQRGPEL